MDDEIDLDNLCPMKTFLRAMKKKWIWDNTRRKKIIKTVAVLSSS